MDINFIVYINRDHELIRRFKTTMVSFHDSQVDLSEKKKLFAGTERYFEAKSKGYNAKMKRTEK